MPFATYSCTMYLNICLFFIKLQVLKILTNNYYTCTNERSHWYTILLFLFLLVLHLLLFFRATPPQSAPSLLALHPSPLSSHTMSSSARHKKRRLYERSEDTI